MNRTTAWGEYALPGQERARAQMLFRKALNEHAPEAMRTIREKAFPAFQRFWAVAPGRFPQAVLKLDPSQGEAADTDEGRAAEADLEGVLREVTPAGLRCDWFYAATLEDMWDWCADPRCEGEWGYGRPSVLGMMETRFKIVVEGYWNPFDGGSEAEVRAWIEQEVERQRAVQFAVIKGRCRDVAEPDALSPEYHYEWLVYRQVHQWSAKKIGEKFGFAEPTVKKVVADLRRTLGLPDVPVLECTSPRGRPRKIRTMVVKAE